MRPAPTRKELTPCPPDHLATLEAATAPPVSLDTARLIAAKIAPATAKNYAALLGQFAEQLRGQPPSDKALAEYLTRRHAEGVAPGSLGVLVYAVRFWEKENERPGEIVGKLSRDVMAGIRREGKGRGRGQVTGLSREDVRVMLRATDTDTTAGARDAALLLVMSDGLLRIGEAVAIDCEHITTEKDGSGRLLIPRSKTDQEGARRGGVPPPPHRQGHREIDRPRWVLERAALSSDAARRPHG